MIAVLFALLSFGQVSLIWNPSPDSRMLTATPSGYVLVYGTASKSYVLSTNVGNVTTCTVKGLTSGCTYYFSIYAFASPDLKSDFSNEVAYTVPGPPPPAGFSIKQR